MIGELEMRFGEVEFAGAGGGTRSFYQTVNPFKARKRGAFYGSIYEYHRNDNRRRQRARRSLARIIHRWE